MAIATRASAFLRASVLAVASGTAFLMVVSTDLNAADQEQWVRLDSAGVETTGSILTISVRDETPRIRAIKLLANDRDVVLTRVVVNYGNGQVHFEEHYLPLRAGELSRVIDERQEARFVESIALTLDATKSSAAGKDIEVWGLGRSEIEMKLRGGVVQRRYAEVPVFYGTTRRRESDRRKNDQTMAVFSGEAGNDLTLGRSIVTVPLERDPGSISRPGLVRQIVLSKEDPNRDFTIATVDVMTKDDFILEMKKQLGSSTRYKGHAFIFVHGYNVGFNDSIFRTAQIAHDIGFDGPAVTFSWPARGGTWDYVHDLNTAKGAREGLRSLLQLVARDVNVNSINLIAHSMGNDPVLEVLREEADVAARGGRSIDFKLNEIVMAAPDVSRSVFEQFVSQFVKLAKGGITLYASSNDLAMEASKRVASGIVRAGDVPKEGILVIPGIESIDVSAANTNFFSMNHSTFAVRQNLVTDVRFLFERTSDKHPPDVRFSTIYKSAGAEAKQWWQYINVRN